MIFLRQKLARYVLIFSIPFWAVNAYPETFTDIAKVATQPCSNDYSRVENCHDNSLPQAPSLSRTALGAGKYDDNIVDFPNGTANTNGTYVLPHHRTSNDGRVVLFGDGARPAVKIFRPENIDDDYKVLGDGQGTGEELYSNKRSILPVVLLHPTRSKLDYSQSTPSMYHHSICDDSSSAFNLSASNASDRNPRYCQAWVSPNGSLTNDSNAVLVDGDCYDLSVMAAATDKNYRWEMVANKFTIFVENPKNTHAGSGVTSRPLVYPRMNQSVLPFYGHYSYSNAHYKPESNSYDWGFNYARNRFIDVCINTPAYPKPGWCDHYDNMQTSADHGTVMDENANGISDSGEYWGGESGKGWAMFEPSITGDGRLLIINAGGSTLWYGYTPNACEIDGWKNLRPISAIPWDTRLNNRYPIARAQKNSDGSISPFRDSLGKAFNHPGNNNRLIGGAYPWIDREGRNIFLSRINDFRDHYMFTNSTPPCAPGTPDYLCSYNPQIANTQMSPDGRPGKGVSVLGAWTRGKVVHLDYRINFSDFGNIDPGGGFSFNSDVMPTFEMPLFEGETIHYQAKAAQNIQSYEHMFNSYNALSPRMPFDVVWTVSTDVAQNSEVVFDEYMLDNALIVAHMNSPITSFNCGEDTCPAFTDDGFTPTNPENSERFDGSGSADFRFRRTPKLQNASTLTTETYCPYGTNQQDLHCSISNWDYHSKIFYFYVPSTSLLYVADYRFLGWLRASCPSNTSRVGRWSQGVKCSINLPNGYIYTDPYVYANYLVVDGQSNTAITPPSFLSALGGAKVQPLALGGVLGKGLWLDGMNDHLEARFHAPTTNDWFAGVWLDNRAQDTLSRTVFTWSDGSRIAISNNYISAILADSDVPGSSKSIPISELGLQNNEYFHFGVKSVLTGNTRVLNFYINGTQLASHISFLTDPNAFNLTKRLPDSKSGFWLGKPGKWDLTPDQTFKGWTDELRLYALSDDEKPKNSYFDESICNLAMGSLVEVREGDGSASTASLRQLYQRAKNYGLIQDVNAVAISHLNQPITKLATVPSVPKAIVCEQLNISSHQEPADLAPQAPSDAICADRVHRNPHPVYSDRCMRRTRHKIENLPIVADLPRPDFSANGFCLSCHADTNTLEELTLEALTAGVHARFEDKRRQPMDVPAVMTGCTPTSPPFLANCHNNSDPLIMDYLFDTNNKVLPY